MTNPSGDKQRVPMWLDPNEGRRSVNTPIQTNPAPERYPGESLEDYLLRTYDPMTTAPFATTWDERNARNPQTGGGGSGSGGGLPAVIRRLVPVAAGLVPAVTGSGGAPTGATYPPELQELLALAMKRMRDQEPLFRSVNAQALAGLPTAYQRNGGQ